jgi:hypothetical protein
LTLVKSCVTSACSVSTDYGECKRVKLLLTQPLHLIAMRHLILKLAIGSGLVALHAAIAGASEAPASFADALQQGKVTFNARLRFERAEQDGLRDASALTLRTRLGYLTLPYAGFQAYLEGENVVAVVDDYFDGVPPNPAGRAVIADPEVTDVNQAWLAYTFDQTKGTFGRQRLALDNHRFVGDVGWRQDLQTFDAFTLQDRTIDKLTLTYGYLWQVNRVFGKALDWDSDSHLVNASYAGLPIGTLTGYGYWMKFSNAAVQSNETYGVSLAGAPQIAEGIKLNYRLEVATQSDFGPSPLNYRARYYLAEAGPAFAKFALAAGYEVLGEDNGQSFRTPLATLHAFNGWADVFLATPQAGLRDYYLRASGAPATNLQLLGFYHRFESDAGSIRYGDEIDLQASYRLNKQLVLLAKAAFFDGKHPSFADRNKFWLQAEYSF